MTTNTASNKMSHLKKAIPWLLVAVIIAVAAFQLRHQGRSWICSCGYVRLWTSGAWTADNSQHWFDPYCLTHLLHGFAFGGLTVLTLNSWPRPWRFAPAIFAEAIWEVIENTNLVIDRYRENTAALGYHGDSVINSLGDIAACAAGIWLAWQLGWRRAIALFLLVEMVLLIWIRDSLVLEIVMLIYPIPAIRVWQMGM